MTQHYIERYWRDAKPEDAIKEPPMVARFQDNDYGFWVIGELIYWDRSEVPWYREEDVGYECCQVYDAPDPGEGWRLVDVDNDKPQEGDEFLLTPRNEWITIEAHPSRRGFAENYIYRRRIEQPKPKYEPFRWEDREQLRGRWIVDSTGEQEYTIDDFLNDSGILYICGHPAEHFLNWTFLDTGEPVGKKTLE